MCRPIGASNLGLSYVQSNRFCPSVFSVPTHLNISAYAIGFMKYATFLNLEVITFINASIWKTCLRKFSWWPGPLDECLRCWMLCVAERQCRRCRRRTLAINTRQRKSWTTYRNCLILRKLCIFWNKISILAILKQNMHHTSWPYGGSLWRLEFVF